MRRVARDTRTKHASVLASPYGQVPRDGVQLDRRDVRRDGNWAIACFALGLL